MDEKKPIALKVEELEERIAPTTLMRIFPGGNPEGLDIAVGDSAVSALSSHVGGEIRA